MARRSAGERMLSDELERYLAAAEKGSLSEAEAALNGIRFDHVDAYALEKVASILDLRRIIESPQRANRWQGGLSGARAHMIGELQSLRRRLVLLHTGREE